MTEPDPPQAGARTGARTGAREPARPQSITFLNSWHTDRVQGSGTTAAIETFADGLRAHGHEVQALIDRENPLPLPFTLRRVLYNLRLPGLLRTGPGPRPDVVIGFDADGVQVPRTGRPYRYVVALKGVAADEARFERGWPRFHLESLGRIERRNAEKADLVIVPSEYSARVVADLYRVEPERISVVPEAIHAEPWEELRSQPPTRTDHRPTVLTVGRQYPRKNTARLIHAMARVRSEIPDVRLRVIGGGPCLPDLRALSEQLGLQDSVELDGAVGSSSEVHRAYFEADMFAMPSLQEGFGIVYLEAMAAGIPVLAGRAGAAPEVIVDGQTGLLCDPLDPETIAEGIIGLLSSPTERTRMGEHGIERAGLFTPTAIAGRFLERMATL